MTTTNLTCARKYIVNEYGKWVGWILIVLIAFTVIMGAAIALKIIDFLWGMFHTTLEPIIAAATSLSNIVFVLYVLVLVYTLCRYTIGIALGGPEQLINIDYHSDGTEKNTEKVTASYRCFEALLLGLFYVVCTMFLTNLFQAPQEMRVFVGILIAVYMVAILVFTIPCCAIAWCKGRGDDPEDHDKTQNEGDGQETFTDALQQTFASKPAEPQSDQENAAASNPTPQIGSVVAAVNLYGEYLQSVHIGGEDCNCEWCRSRKGGLHK